VADKRGVESAVRTTPAVAYRRPRLPEGRRRRRWRGIP